MYFCMYLLQYVLEEKPLSLHNANEIKFCMEADLTTSSLDSRGLKFRQVVKMQSQCTLKMTPAVGFNPRGQTQPTLSHV